MALIPGFQFLMYFPHHGDSSRWFHAAHPNYRVPVTNETFRDSSGRRYNYVRPPGFPNINTLLQLGGSNQVRFEKAVEIVYQGYGEPHLILIEGPGRFESIPYYLRWTSADGSPLESFWRSDATHQVTSCPSKAIGFLYSRVPTERQQYRATCLMIELVTKEIEVHWITLLTVEGTCHRIEVPVSSLSEEEYEVLDAIRQQPDKLPQFPSYTVRRAVRLFNSLHGS